MLGCHRSWRSFFRHCQIYNPRLMKSAAGLWILVCLNFMKHSYDAASSARFPPAQYITEQNMPVTQNEGSENIIDNRSEEKELLNHPETLFDHTDEECVTADKIYVDAKSTWEASTINELQRLEKYLFRPFKSDVTDLDKSEFKGNVLVVSDGVDGVNDSVQLHKTVNIKNLYKINYLKPLVKNYRRALDFAETKLSLIDKGESVSTCIFEGFSTEVIKSKLYLVNTIYLDLLAYELI